MYAPYGLVVLVKLKVGVAICGKARTPHVIKGLGLNLNGSSSGPTRLIKCVNLF